MLPYWGLLWEGAFNGETLASLLEMCGSANSHYPRPKGCLLPLSEPKVSAAASVSPDKTSRCVQLNPDQMAELIKWLLF